MSKLMIALATLLGSSIALAETKEEFQLRMYAGQVILLESSGSGALEVHYTIAGCYKVVADARAALHGELVDRNYKPIEGARQINGKYYLALDLAERAICDRFRAAHLLAQVPETVESTQRILKTLEQDIRIETDWVNKGPSLVKDAAQCSADLDKLVAAGAPTNVKAPNFKLTIPEVKVQICDALAKRAATFDTEQKTAIKEAHDALVKPLAAAGIAGDKLQLLVDHENYTFQGVGGAELTTPAQLAKARVIFELTSEADGWTVRRYAFSGNKLASTSFETYIIRPGSRAFR